MSDVTETFFVEDGASKFRALVEAHLSLQGKMEAIRRVGSRLNMTESEARRVYDANLKSISAGRYERIRRWYQATVEAEARKTTTKRAIADLKQERFDDAVYQRTGAGNLGGVALRRSGRDERRRNGNGKADYGTLSGPPVRPVLGRDKD